MGDDPIMNDLLLLVAFHTSFLFPCFRLIQTGDPDADVTAAFIDPHVAIKYFLMLEDLARCKAQEKHARVYDNMNNNTNNTKDKQFKNKS